MDGKITDDGYYINGWGIPAKYVHVDGILNTLDEKETFAYHDALDGIILSWRGKYNEMVSQYLLPIQRDPVPSFSANNLGWFYAIAPGSYNDGKQAVKYASQAAAQFPGNGDILDTLACAYARLGVFDKAAEAANMAARADYAPNGGLSPADGDAVNEHKPCADPGFGHDPKPFRPHEAYPSLAKPLLREADRPHQMAINL